MSGCPVDHTKSTSVPSTPGGGCPVDHSKVNPLLFGSRPPSSSSSSSSLSSPKGIESENFNPDNLMPSISQTRLAGQTFDLPTDRSMSTIPKGEAQVVTKGSSVWEYPSPQQFYSALKRKGWETEEKEVPVMVEIHNFLNEACWNEVLKWEKKYQCDCSNPSLLRFRGRPTELSPKARLFTFFGGDKPFDRHDWTVDRCGKEVRYVIDYYGGTDEITEGSPAPVFHVDVRPALDSPGAFVDRTGMFLGEFWGRWFGSAPAAQVPTAAE